MKVVVIIARILLGLIFFVFGLNGFLHFIPMPPMPPSDATTFSLILIRSHYIYLISGTQVVAGFLLLIGQFVPLAEVLLAAMLANIFAFHIALQHGSGIGMGVIALVLWLIVAWGYRAQLLPIFARKPAVVE
jgi:putative oxidoreductase